MAVLLKINKLVVQVLSLLWWRVDVTVYIWMGGKEWWCAIVQCVLCKCCRDGGQYPCRHSCIAHIVTRRMKDMVSAPTTLTRFFGYSSLLTLQLNWFFLRLPFQLWLTCHLACSGLIAPEFSLAKKRHIYPFPCSYHGWGQLQHHRLTGSWKFFFYFLRWSSHDMFSFRKGGNFCIEAKNNTSKQLVWITIESVRKDISCSTRKVANAWSMMTSWQQWHRAQQARRARE